MTVGRVVSQQEIDAIRGALVTVVTPTFDRPDMLRSSVRSVVGQTHKNIEHIVVGDSCPALDCCREQLLEINPALRLHNLAPDEPKAAYGPARIARVRNAGNRLAQGDFIAHLDDDNTWDPNHLESLLEAFTRRPDAAVAFSYRKLLIEGREPYRPPYHPWSPDLGTAREVYEAYRRMGIYQPGSHLMRDRISFHEERACTLDTNELLVRADIHREFPFRTEYSAPMLEQELGEDDVFCEEVYRAGYTTVASGEFSLNFRLGGRFTSEILARVRRDAGNATPHLAEAENL